jgi:hypothetical protein
MELLLFAAIIFKRILTPVLFFFFETVRNVPFVFLSMTVKAFGCARNVFLMENLSGVDGSNTWGREHGDRSQYESARNPIQSTYCSWHP